MVSNEGDLEFRPNINQQKQIGEKGEENQCGCECW